MKKVLLCLSLALIMLCSPLQTQVFAQDAAVQEDEDGFVISGSLLAAYHGTEEVVNVPEGITAIENHAFQGNTAVTQIIIPEGVTSIGEEPFEDCLNLKRVYLPKSLRDIPHNLFSMSDMGMGCNATVYTYTGTAIVDYLESHMYNYYLLDGSEFISINKGVVVISSDPRMRDENLCVRWEKVGEEEAYEQAVEGREGTGLLLDVYLEDEKGNRVTALSDMKLLLLTLKPVSYDNTELYQIYEDKTAEQIPVEEDEAHFFDPMAVKIRSDVKQLGRFLYMMPSDIGDIDNDNEITASDALHVLKHIVKLEEWGKILQFTADVDGDGEVTAEDGLMILKRVVKLIDKFPAEYVYGAHPAE